MLPNGLVHQVALHDVHEGHSGELLAHALPKAIPLRVNGSLGLLRVLGEVQPGIPDNRVVRRLVDIANRRSREDVAQDDDCGIDARGR